MRSVLFLAWCMGVVGCESTDIDNVGGAVTIVYACPTSEMVDLVEDATAGGPKDPDGVVQTCDDHLPCTWDIQCTPCSQVPEELRIKATCTWDNQIDPFCLDSATGTYLYTGCVHFIDEPTPAGKTSVCFPVAHSLLPNGYAYSGVCNEWGVCVDNP